MFPVSFLFSQDSDGEWHAKEEYEVLSSYILSTKQKLVRWENSCCVPHLLGSLSLEMLPLVFTATFSMSLFP